MDGTISVEKGYTLFQVLMDFSNHSEEKIRTLQSSTESFDDNMQTTYDTATWVSAIPLFVLTFINIVANGVILLVFLRSKSIRKCRNVYILSLAFSDFFVGLTMPFAITETINRQWTFSSDACLVYLTIRGSLLLISVSSVVLLTVDRWWSINFPISYRVRQSRRTATVLVVTIWVVSLILHIPINFTTNILNSTSTRSYCIFPESHRTKLTISSSVISCFLPVVILLFLNIGINVKLFKRRNSKKLRRSLSTNESSALYTRKFSLDSNYSSSTTSDDGNIVQKVVDPRRNSYFFIMSKRPSTTRPIPFYHRQSSIATPNFQQKSIDSESNAPRSASSSLKQNVPTRKQSDDIVRDFLVRQDKKAILSLSLLAVVCVICRIPFYFLSIVQIACGDCIPDWTIILTFWICVANSAINPFLYGFGNTYLRKTLRSFLRRSILDKVKIKEALRYCSRSESMDTNILTEV